MVVVVVVVGRPAASFAASCAFSDLLVDLLSGFVRQAADGIQRGILPQVAGHIVEDDPVDLTGGVGGVVADVVLTQRYPR